MNQATPILVTGASGYLASWIIKLLLAEGRDVHATVRSFADKGKFQHLEKLNEGKGKLSLFEADLQRAGSFDAAMAGCECVIHTASPFVISGIKNPQTELIVPAVEGTRNVLESVNRINSVRRVVLTSSVAAIFGDSIEARGRGPFTEADWNTTSTPEHQPYSCSKTLAEKTAWEIARRQTRWDLISLNPGFILGPAVNPGSAGVSNSLMKDLAFGKYKSGVIDLWFGIVDVRDVARAHVQAGFTSAATGRYIISNRSASMLNIAQILRSEFGDKYPIPKRNTPKAIAWLLAPVFGLTRKYVARNVGYRVEFDHRRSIQELQLAYHPMESTITEHFAQVISSRQNR